MKKIERLMKLTLTNILFLLRHGRYYLLIIAILFISNSFPHESLANKTLSDTFVSIVKSTKAPVVNIRTTKILKNNIQNKGFRIKGQGSGVVYNKNGLIVTNKHVIKNAGEIIVRLYDGSEYKAEIVGTDERSDIAVLRIDAENLIPARFGNSDSLELGEIVLAIGNPVGLGQTVTSGIISAKGTSNLQITGFEDFVQTDATINPDSYGGPLVNMNGKVVGISTLLPEQTAGYFGISLAIPINVVHKIAGDLIKHGRITRGWLGVTAQPVTRELQKALGLKTDLGALVSDIEPGSSAANAGVKSGDVIIKYNGKKIKNLLHLRSLVKGTEINKEVEMTVLRDGLELILNTVILEAKKSEAKSKNDLFRNLGLAVQNLTGKLSINLGYKDEKGVIITNVQQGSPASKAGLTTGDLIVEVQHKPVTSSDELYQAILKIQNEEDILIFIKRPDKASKFIILKQEKDV
ncbi:Periplasmic serine endoprotease DegP precursor [Candidatus Brocadiaceae bacterium S225]|nr:Periplasmic serine endoprotease DegP precursor [Candidatus Brocadiaceae bacterium S225]